MEANGSRRPTGSTNEPASSSSSSSLSLSDYAAFQMAISGPTGDYLMSWAGHAEDGGEDDIVDWFLSLGFESEGLLVESEGDEPDDGDEGVYFIHHQRRSSSSPHSRSSATLGGLVGPKPATIETKPTMVDKDDHPLQMSCNLRDLGDFLGDFPSGLIGR